MIKNKTEHGNGNKKWWRKIALFQKSAYIFY